VLVADPVDQEEDDCAKECEEPPVREFLIKLLDAIVLVWAKDDFSLLLSKLSTAYFWRFLFVVHGCNRCLVFVQRELGERLYLSLLHAKRTDEGYSKNAGG